MSPDELDQMILRTAILTGGLELLPHSLATMAIIPVQMRMVYHIGQRYGFQMDRQHLTEFLAARDRADFPRPGRDSRATSWAD